MNNSKEFHIQIPYRTAFKSLLIVYTNLPYFPRCCDILQITNVTAVCSYLFAETIVSAVTKIRDGTETTLAPKCFKCLKVINRCAYPLFVISFCPVSNSSMLKLHLTANISLRFIKCLQALLRQCLPCSCLLTLQSHALIPFMTLFSFVTRQGSLHNCPGKDMVPWTFHLFPGKLPKVFARCWIC